MSNNSPEVSFCIPTLNSEKTLEDSLKSIKMQNYSRFEIIIVDGYSTDSTIKVAQRYADKLIFSRGTYSEACQLGVEESKGEIVALFDSDIIIPHKNWLRNAIKPFTNPDISTVWPLLQAPTDSSIVSKCYNNFSGKVLIHRLKKRKGIVGGTNALFKKKCLIEVGGFDKQIDWGGDFYIAKRLEEKGYKVAVLCNPLHHKTMTTLTEFLKKQKRGAKSFLKVGLESTGLTLKDMLYEHTALSIQLILDGIFRERDITWACLPFLIASRLIVYSSIFWQKLFAKSIRN